MTNQAEVGVVTLEGRGFANKPRGGYRSGEFSRLYNCELTEYGSIKRRRGIANAEILATTYTDKRRFGGVWGTYGIWLPRQGMTTAAGYSIAGAGRKDLASPDAESCNIIRSDGTLLVNAATYADTFDSKNWHPYVVEGFQRYNKQNYWIGSGVLSTVDGVPSYTYRKAVIWIAKRNDAPGVYQDTLDLGDAVTATASQYNIKIIGEIDIIGDTTDTASILPQTVAGGNAWPVITHFMHKDRLWIVTPTQLLFSKATDPYEFRVSQDGGFISMADAEINWAVPVGDSIYIFSDSKIDVLTYSDSPNVDGQTTRISTALGADSACEHNNNIYFVKYNALYEVNGTRVEKVMDLNWNVEAGLTSANGRNNLPKYYRIWSYYKYLIVGHVARTYGTANAAGENVLGANKNSRYFVGYSAQYSPCPDLTARPDGFGYKIPTNFFMINTDTGAVSEFGYHPQKELRDQSCIFEVAPIAAENDQNQQTLQIGCLENITALGVKAATGGKMAFFYMWPPTFQNDGILGNFGQDAAYTGDFPNLGNNAGPISSYSAFVIRDLAPDGLEYNMKKFRSLLVEGTIEAKSLKFKFSFDDGPVTAAVDVGPSNTNVPPQGYRVGLNQRARAMNISMVDDPDFVNNTSNWEIFDIRFLWTYLTRGPVRRSGLGPG